MTLAMFQNRMADFYRPYYGDETDDLFLALAKPQEKIALLNPWISKEKLGDVLSSAQPEEILGYTFHRLPTHCAPRLIDGLMSHYFLDRSSVLAPLLLPLTPNMRVLDMCSAPGGKLLVMLARQIDGLFYVANDLSRARALRLKKVIQGFVPASFVRASLDLIVKDAHYFGLKEPGSFDAVLLDAPCSSEGHVIEQEQKLKGYKGPQKSLPQRQYSLLAAALLALKPGGHVMYATCTINPQENQGVIKKALSKKQEQCVLSPLASPIGDQGPYGVTILPNRHQAGPAFLSLLRRQ